MTSSPSDPAASIREVLASPDLDEADRRDLLRQALIYAEEVRNGYLSEKKRADELEEAKAALEVSAVEMQQHLDALRRTDQERRRLLFALVMAQEEERTRIAGEIHDDSIQVMAAVGMRLTSIRKRLSDPRSLELVDRLDGIIEESIRRLRNLLFVLRPIALEKEGLAAALREYVRMTQEKDGPRYEVADSLETEPAEELRIILFRLAQEALTNIRKHAKAQFVEVVLERRDHGIQLTVKDDGRGFARGDDAPGHLGLMTSRERAEQAGGWYRVESKPGGGTTVTCWLPSKGAAKE